MSLVERYNNIYNNNTNNNDRQSDSKPMQTCERVRADSIAEIAYEKNPAHLPKCGGKVTTFKTWGLSRFKLVKC